MLTQPIFAQRVCMGVDKYAFEVEGCCLVYCWWGVDFENIHLATLKLRSFASIWNLFFWKYADSDNFCSEGVHGSGQICIWGWRLLSGVLLMMSRFWTYTFGNSQIEVICVNLESVFFKICWLSQFLLKGCAWEWTNMPLRLKGVVWCIVDEE